MLTRADSEDQKNNPPHNAGATTDERSEYPVFLHLEKGNPTLAESQTTRQSTTNDSRNESVLTEVENEGMFLYLRPVTPRFAGQILLYFFRELLNDH